MTSRARLSRRPLQVGGLLLATVALGTVTAPAASAAVDHTQPGAQTPLQAPVEQPRVLTLVADGFTGTADDPAFFGQGKLQVSIAPEPVEDPNAPSTPQDPADDTVTGMAGATVVVTVTDVVQYSDAFFVLGPDVEGDTATCTTEDDGSCVLTSDDPDLVQDGELVLVQGMSFTVQQTTAPTSGGYDLPPAGHDVFHGEVGRPLSVAFAPTSSQSGDGDAVLRFYDPTRALAGGSSGPAAGAPAAGSPAAAGTTDPATAGAAGSGTPGTGTATATPALATTGADVGPMAAVGAGLLVAGGAGLVLARRRTTR